MSEFKSRFLYSLDLQFMSSSCLVLARMFYSGSCHNAHVHYRRLSSLKIGLVNAVFGWERNGRKEGGKGLQGGHYFHVINIHQMNVKILIGQFSKHVTHGLDT